MKDAQKLRSFFLIDAVKHAIYCIVLSIFELKELVHLYQNMPDNTASADLNAIQKTQYDYYQKLNPYLNSVQGDWCAAACVGGLIWKDVDLF